jgi:hypothetical protein
MLINTDHALIFTKRQGGITPPCRYSSTWSVIREIYFLALASSQNSPYKGGKNA